jgi:hypothetical protein
MKKKEILEKIEETLRNWDDVIWCYNCKISEICRIWHDGELKELFDEFCDRIHKLTGFESVAVELRKQCADLIARTLAENCEYYVEAEDEERDE